MSGNSSAINLFGRRELNNPNDQTVSKTNSSPNLPENLILPTLLNSNKDQIWQASFLRRSLEQKFQNQRNIADDLNGLSAQTPVKIVIKLQDTQADVLRRAYKTYAVTAGLSEENQQTFVETMMKSGGEFIQHHDSEKLFTAKEFQMLKRGGGIEMFPTGEQLGELHRLKTEENETITVESKAYSETGEITFADAGNAKQNYAVVRRYLQQNLLGADFYFVEHGDEATVRALALGVKPELEEIGKNDRGETVYRVKITPDDAEKFKQLQAEYNDKKAVFEEKTAQARSETNQMFADQGRVLWNSLVNVAEGTVNQAIDAALTSGGTNPLPLLNPFRPRLDFSGAKSDYRSEMMRRDSSGKVDGDGIKAGQFIEIGVTVIAPLVVGKVFTPAASPQSLKNLGGIPEVETSAVSGVVNQNVPNPAVSNVAPVGSNIAGKVKYTSKEMLPNYVGEETGSVWGTKVKYLTETERANLELFVRDGKIVDRAGNLYDTSSSSSVFGAGQGKSIFVMEEQGRIYASNYQSVGKFHHSSILGGKPVSAAGEITVQNGKVIEISNRSGHYQPSQPVNQQVIDELKSRGIDVSNIKISDF